MTRPQTALDRLGAGDLRTVVTRFRDALRAHQDELNRLNVYPVPDGDTGTNMALTLESVANEIGTADTMPEVCHAIAHGSLMGARGNSGVILSQILRGLADTFTGLDAVDAAAMVTGLRHASDAAYQAVMRPVEGTILTVVRSAAEAAEAAAQDGAQGLVPLLDRCATAAREAVDRTPELLPVLKSAGVVDAGGRGFTLLLDALLEVTDGRPIPEPEVVNTPPAVEAHLRGDDISSLRYEVMYLLEAADETVSAFKDAWGSIGDSIVVVGGEGMWNCHVHTNDIGAAIEAGIEAGRPCRIRVTDLHEQVEEESWVREHARDGDETVAHSFAPEEVTTAVVAVAVGEGVRRLYSSLGVQAVVAGGQSMNPSTQQILDAVESVAARSVVILPNNKNIVPVARQVAEITEREVAVVPTSSVVEGLALLVCYDAAAPLDANVKGMEQTLERVRSGEVTQAVRDGSSDAGAISAGDWIALDRDGIRAVAPSPVEALVGLLDHLVDDDSELVTVLCGADSRQSDASRIEQHLALAHPHVEVEFHQGDQPLYPYLVGVE
ncbi:MAG TPA: DAK2 domain-containing protein [Acidimicrobiia bacterium]|nr:DAK2 domain-containing protein [Acidimicrobiia bacterium]